FTANSAFNQLNIGDKVEETFTVSSLDGTPSTIKVTINGTNDAAVISGTDTGDVHESHYYTAPDGHMTGGSVDDRSPDHMHGNIGKLSNDLIHTEGQLIITDADKGESHVATGTYQGHYGHIIMLPSGEWNYYASIGQNSTGREIDHLGQGEVLTDTVAIKSADGTRHDINITIHGDNDRPYCSAEVTLVNGEEDKAIILTSAQLLQNTVDVDANDAGKLSIDNLQATHGAITVNPDGTFTFTPEKDYNGDVHFDYDVKDVHGGITHTGASVVLSSEADSAIITGQDTGAVDEGYGHYFDMSPDYGKSQLTSEALYADGKLDIIDPDLGESKFDDHGGGYSYSGQYGRINLHEDGTWHYMVDIGHNGFTTGTSTTNVGTTIDKLGDGDSLTDTITVYSKDGTAHDIVVTIHGDNDAPYCSSEVQLNSGKEDIAQTLTLNQLLQNTVDVDTNDAGQLAISNLQVDHGSIAVNTNGTFLFTPEKDYNGSVHFNYDVKDAHGGVTHTGANIDLAAVDDAAIITGQSTGDVDEGYGTFGDRSPDYAQPGMAKIGQDVLTADGKLDIVDPDTGESEFDPKGRGWNNSYHGQYGHLLLNTDGTWHYIVPVGSVNWVNNRKTTIGTAIDKLGEGQTLTDTVTIQSKDGTTHDIVITIHGDNDKPYCSSEVQLNSGKEDLAQTITSTELLANTVDVDANDLGKLTIENLHANHGSIATNPDGSFEFTPEKNYNGDVHFTYDVKDAHGGITHTGASTSLTAVDDKAIISGLDTGDIHESSRPNRSPDHAQPGMGEITNDLLYIDGKLNITDGDSGESTFDSKGPGYSYHGQYGHLMLLKDGTWHYTIEVGQQASGIGSIIDKLGENERLTDTIKVFSKDGTGHDIVITIHGDNDRPYCSSEVQLHSGKEDLAQTITSTELLANTIDVDHNDAGNLSIANLHADHGSIRDNNDGTFTFTPNSNYNGKVQFTYDVKDAHGGVTHTGAATTLVAVNDKPDVQPLTDSVIEGATSPRHLDLLAGATDKEGDALNIEQLSFSVDGGKSSQLLPSGLSIAKDGHTLLVDATDPAFNYLNAGQPLNIVASYLVSDGHGGQTQQTAVLTIEGTDDKAVLVSNVIQMSETEALQSEFTRYQGKLQLIDPDTGDNTQFQFGGVYIGQGFPPGELDIWPDGSYSFHLETALNRHADDLVSSLHQGESMEFPYTVKTTDGQTVTIMVKVIGEDSQARIEVGRYSSVDNHVTEDHFTPGTTHNLISSTGYLHVIDPDHDQAGFIAQDITTSEGGRFHINALGSWAYNIDNSKLQHLGAGESYQKTFTVESIDGSAHRDITVTVHGTNDNPVIFSAVSLPAGIEDTKIILTSAQLLANATDVDDNDAGQLSIANLQTDHGSILANVNGTFTFTPEANYNGQVNFTYDVKDAHGGITHTSASTTLAAVNDAGVITGDKSGTVTEDNHVQGDAQHTIYTVGVLDVTDPDAGENHFHESHNVHALHDPFGGSFTIGKAGDWSYSVPNTNVQHLAKDQVETVQYEVITQGGDKQIVTVSIHGTNDDPILSVTQTTPVTGTLTETDVDVKDTHSFSVVSPTGQFGDLSVDPTSGAYVYTPNSSVSGMSYNSATHTYHGADVFEVKVADNHGGESSRFLTFDTNGQVNLITGQQPTITTTVPQNPVVTTTQPSLPTSSNTPPSNTVTVDLAASSDSGKSDTDNLTNNNTPTITGHTDIPYSQVTVYDGSTPIGHAVSDGSGQYSAVVTNLTDGDHNLSATALAPSSSLPATSPLLSVHVDTTIAPLTIELTHDTGSSASDLITNDGALTIGRQDAGATVEYSTDNGQTWTSSFTPQPGSNTVSVRQTDTAGNVSANTSLNFTLDNSIAAPTVSLTHDTGRHSISTPNLITQDSQLSIQTEAGAKVEYSNDGGHSWTAVFNPVEGVNNLQVRQTDIAGNLSPATHFSFTLDTTPGTVTVNPISQDNALNAAENNQPLVITGTTSNVDPGDVVYVIVGNNHFYDATVKSDGSWSLTLSASAHQSILAADHDYPIQVGAVDAAGNSTPRISTHLLVDTQNPIPHIAVDSVTQDNVLNALESGQSIPITGTVTGDYHTGDTVSLKINGANIPSLTGTVDAAGHFSIPVAGNVLERANIHTSYASGQAAPIHSIEATIQTTDAVGNTGSATTGSQVFTVDTQIHIGIHTDPVTVDNVINDQESHSSVDITGSVSGDFNTGDLVILNVNGTKHTGAVDSLGHYSIAVPGRELIADADQKIEASIAVTDSAGNNAHATTDVVYQVDTQVSLPTVTFESAGADNLYSKAEIARGDANTITATITPPGDAKIGEHLVVNGQDHVLDANTLANGVQIEVRPGAQVQVTMTDEHGNTAGSQGFAASAIPDPIIVKAPPGSHHVSGSLGTPPLLPSLTPVPTAQHGWRIHLPDGSYVTSHHGQYGTLTIDPQTGDLHYQEQANVHTGPHGSASGIGQHEDKFEVALQGTNQDEVVAHVNVQILSHGPGHSGKLNIGTEVVDMTITPITHTSHPAPPPPPQVLHDEPDMSSQADFTVTQSDDSYLDLTQHAHQAPDQKTSHHGAAAYLDALDIKPDTTSTEDHDQPADMDIVLAQVDQQDAATHDQAHLDMSDAFEHHDTNVNHNQDDEHHHHNDVDGLPDIDPNP
ncbi:hypothetical protein DS893_00690, partial [Vibrionales bacterium C3R12]